MLKILSEEGNVHTEEVQCFSLYVSDQLHLILKESVHNGKFRKGTMYASYHSFVSDRLCLAWDRVEKHLNKSFDPALPQMVADIFLCVTIKQEVQALPSSAPTPTVQRQLSEVEDNTIMYAAGYVVQVLFKQYEQCTDLMAADYVECLENMLEGSLLDVHMDATFEDFASCWVKEGNCGGLVILRQGAYWLFREVEMLLWPFLKNLGTVEASFDKRKATETIALNDNILFKWSMMDIDICDSEQSEHLLKEIIDKWITIRGFSYTSRIVETYKKARGSSMTKEKGLQKQLQSDSQNNAK